MSAGPALQSMAARPQRSIARWAAVLLAAAGALAVSTASGSAAETLASGAAAYKPYAVEHIGQALAAAKQMQAAIKAGDGKGAQAAWIKSRAGWESVEPITGEFFPDLDKAIDAWPDSKQGYHAIEAPLFAGKLDNLAAPADQVVADLATFDKKLEAKGFKFAPQGLLNGATKLAYEIGENKSKGGESPYAGTSISDIYENNEGIEAVYKLVFHDALKARDAKLDKRILDKIEAVEDFVKGKDLKSVDAAGLHKAGEELAVLLQSAAAKLKLKKPAVGD
jgi:iron uptake system EfeUOB component EfeO/EfeM